MECKNHFPNKINEKGKKISNESILKKKEEEEKLTIM